MRIRFLLTLLITCAGVASAQSPSQSSAPNSIAVGKFSARPIPTRTDWDAPSDSASATNQTIEDLRSLPSRDPNVSPVPVPVGMAATVRGRDRVIESKKPRTADAPIYLPPRSTPLPGVTVSQNRTVYNYEVRITNVGKDTITAVAWEYWFVQPETGIQMDRRKFRNFRRLDPGRTITLNGKSYGPRVVSVAGQEKKRKPFEERVVIKCIAYSDGKFNSLDLFSESDCDLIRTDKQQQRR